MLHSALLPGIDGTGRFFAPFMKCLPDGWRSKVVTYPTDVPLGYAELTDLAYAARPNSEKYLLVAESFSGPVVTNLAARHPRGLVGILIVCTFATTPPILRYAPAKLIAKFPFWKLPAQITTSMLIGNDGSPPMRNLLHETLKEVTPALWRARIEAVANLDVATELQSIDVPMLYIAASRKARGWKSKDCRS
ncbi:MAG: alpha/beta hydrolase [Gammaproteobacteria bacterium]|nr:alpha/beta hydrolase [Gammaproteobacteria bacterium]MDH3468096.1 alpha/beta hydrolase [Gammaproteobacteria bacterium]